MLTPEDVAVERQVKANVIAGTEDDITVALDTVLNAELISEGIARELVNKINTMRRDMDFAVTDRIHVKLQTVLKSNKRLKSIGITSAMKCWHLTLHLKNAKAMHGTSMAIRQ